MQKKYDDAALSKTLIEYIENIPNESNLEFCEANTGYICLKLNFKQSLNNPLGIIYGGAIATLIDTAAVFSMYSNIDKQPKTAMTISMNINYFKAAFSVDLVAHATVLKLGKKIGFAQVRVEEADTKSLIANGQLSFSLAYD